MATYTGLLFCATVASVITAIITACILSIQLSETQTEQRPWIAVQSGMARPIKRPMRINAATAAHALTARHSKATVGIWEAPGQEASGVCAIR